MGTERSAPKGRKHDDGNRKSSNGADSASDGTGERTPPEIDANSTSTGPTTALSRMSSRYDGWLRISPDGEGKAVYLKWKWTKGLFSNKYVMVLVEVEKILWGLELLEHKIDEVELLIRRPVEDRWYQ